MVLIDDKKIKTLEEQEMEKINNIDAEEKEEATMVEWTPAWVWFLDFSGIWKTIKNLIHGIMIR